MTAKEMKKWMEAEYAKNGTPNFHEILGKLNRVIKYEESREAGILFSNDFVIIVEVNVGEETEWVRVDRILATASVVNSYFNEEGKLIKK